MPQSRRLSHLRRAVTVHLARRLRAHPVVQSEGRLLVVILISVLSGEAAVALHHAIHVVTHLVQALGEATHGGWHTLVIVMVPTLGGLLTGLILRFLVPAARGSGIPQVKLDLAMRRGEIPLRVALDKFVTTTLAVGSGGAVGREGPTVQIRASMGATMARWLPPTVAQIRMLGHAAAH